MAGKNSEKKTKVGAPSKKKTNDTASSKNVRKSKKSIRSNDGVNVIGATEIEKRDLCQEASKLRDLIAEQVPMLMRQPLSNP